MWYMCRKKEKGLKCGPRGWESYPDTREETAVTINQVYVHYGSWAEVDVVAPLLEGESSSLGCGRTQVIDNRWVEGWCPMSPHSEH